mmetsp:Transcript_42791/g.110344  ORF Transcript_42791/g.110344 Transcript_42791/m.110344 type:complete len:235 (-) Transcript_42791:245-949(-)
MMGYSRETRGGKKGSEKKEVIALAVLQSNPPAHVDMYKKETYLSDSEFQSTFKIGREAFYHLPEWKQADLKEKAGLGKSGASGGRSGRGWRDGGSMWGGGGGGGDQGAKVSVADMLGGKPKRVRERRQVPHSGGHTMKVDASHPEGGDYSSGEKREGERRGEAGRKEERKRVSSSSSEEMSDSDAGSTHSLLSERRKKREEEKEKEKRAPARKGATGHPSYSSGSDSDSDSDSP